MFALMLHLQPKSVMLLYATMGLVLRRMLVSNVTVIMDTLGIHALLVAYVILFKYCLNINHVIFYFIQVLKDTLKIVKTILHTIIHTYVHGYFYRNIHYVLVQLV